MKFLTKSKDNNVISLTDSELAALSVPSVKIEIAERDEDGIKYSYMTQNDFWEILQLHAFQACTGKIDVKKFRVIFRDIFSYLAANNIPVAQIADNKIDISDCFKEADKKC